MAFDQNLHSTSKSFPAFIANSTSPDLVTEDVAAAFEDRLWTVAEAVITAGAPSISVVAEAASLVRFYSATFASILSGAAHLKSLDADAGPCCDEALGDDIARTEDHLVSRLRDDLANF